MRGEGETKYVTSYAAVSCYCSEEREREREPPPPPIDQDLVRQEPYRGQLCSYKYTSSFKL